MKLRALLLTALAALLLCSCERTAEVHLFQAVDADGWSREQKVAFDLSPILEEQDYDLTFEARLDKRFEYEDLWVIVTQDFTPEQEPSNQKDGAQQKASQKEAEKDSLQKDSLQQDTPKKDFALLQQPKKQHYVDTLHLILNNKEVPEEAGKDLATYHLPIRFVHLHKNETGRITVQHIMDEESIKGVHDVGIHMQTVEAK